MSKLKYLGQSEWSNGNKVYKQKYTNGRIIYETISWLLRRCKRCGRFLGRNKKKFCSNCFIENRKVYQRKYIKEYRRNGRA
jgi:hypothetical protein